MQKIIKELQDKSVLWLLKTKTAIDIVKSNKPEKRNRSSVYCMFFVVQWDQTHPFVWTKGNMEKLKATLSQMWMDVVFVRNTSHAVYARHKRDKTLFVV